MRKKIKARFAISKIKRPKQRVKSTSNKRTISIKFLGDPILKTSRFASFSSFIINTAPSDTKSYTLNENYPIKSCEYIGIATIRSICKDIATNKAYIQIELFQFQKFTEFYDDCRDDDVSEVFRYIRPLALTCQHFYKLSQAAIDDHGSILEKLKSFKLSNLETVHFQNTNETYYKLKHINMNLATNNLSCFQRIIDVATKFGLKQIEKLRPKSQEIVDKLMEHADIDDFTKDCYQSTERSDQSFSRICPIILTYEQFCYFQKYRCGLENGLLLTEKELEKLLPHEIIKVHCELFPLFNRSTFKTTTYFSPRFTRSCLQLPLMIQSFLNRGTRRTKKKSKPNLLSSKDPFPTRSTYKMINLGEGKIIRNISGINKKAKYRQQNFIRKCRIGSAVTINSMPVNLFQRQLESKSLESLIQKYFSE